MKYNGGACCCVVRDTDGKSPWGEPQGGAVAMQALCALCWACKNNLALSQINGGRLRVIRAR